MGRAHGPRAWERVLHLGMQTTHWIGIGIGDAIDRGKSYGTEAMRVALRYLFEELEMERASLGVFADNVRAVRSYQRAGFVIEGRQREDTLREGRRWDAFFMGVLSSEFRVMSVANSALITQHQARLLRRRHQNGVDHMDDAVLRDDVGLQHICIVGIQHAIF